MRFSPVSAQSTRVLCLLVALSCVVQTAPSWAQGKGDSPKPAPKLRTSGDIEADLLKERDRAEFNVNLAKKKLAKDPDALATTKQKYTEAWRAANLLVEDIQRSVRDGKKPSSSKLFAKRAADAQTAIAQFNEHVEITVMDPKDRPKFVPIALLPLFGSLADMLWKNMDERRKANAAERKARQEEMAAELERVKFRDFDKVPL